MSAKWWISDRFTWLLLTIIQMYTITSIDSLAHSPLTWWICRLMHLLVGQVCTSWHERKEQTWPLLHCNMMLDAWMIQEKAKRKHNTYNVHSGEKWEIWEALSQEIWPLGGKWMTFHIKKYIRHGGKFVWNVTIFLGNMHFFQPCLA